MKMTRWLLALAPLLLLASSEAQEKHAAGNHYLAYVGTYTTETASKGIYAFRYDASSGKLEPLGVAAETEDPSWIAIHPNGKFLYAVKEAGKNSMVSGFALNAQTGKLTLLDQLPALGEDPCYISLDKTGKYLLVANYSSGNVVVFPVGADGKLGPATANVRDEGPLGPNKERQEGPHAHWIETSVGNRFAFVSDLGLDRVLIYKFDAEGGRLSNPDPSQPDAFSSALPPGSGPRHVAFSHDGKFMYVLGELQSTVTTFANEAGEKYRALQTVSALPAAFSRRNDAAEIALHPSGKFIYTSNRGLDSIAVFHVEGSGLLRLAANVRTGGKEPRHFSIDPSGN